MSIEEYAQQIKSTVFGMTGALGSRMEKIVDELLSNVMATQAKAKLQGEEILRLQDLLNQNKIPHEKAPNGKVTTAPKAK